VDAPAKLLEFAVHAITEGIDALGEVTVRIEAEDGATATNAQRDYEQSRTYGGHGADTDIIVASVKAYLAALNKMLVATGQYAQQPEVAAVLN
jgi:2-isopropylmalate synthase